MHFWKTYFQWKIGMQNFGVRVEEVPTVREVKLL